MAVTDIATCHLVELACIDYLAVIVLQGRPIVNELFKLPLYDKDQYRRLLAFSSIISVCELMSLNILELPPEEYKSLIYLSIPGLTTIPSLRPSVLIFLSSADLISSAQVTMLLSLSLFF